MKLKLDENLPESLLATLGALGHDVDNMRVPGATEAFCASLACFASSFHKPVRLARGVLASLGIGSAPKGGVPRTGDMQRNGVLVG